MTTPARQLHVVFLPFMASGHTIPMLDIVRLFAARDHVTSTVITTPYNAPNITKSLENCKTGTNSTISIHIIPFPSHEPESGLKDGIENLDQVTSQDLYSKFVFSAQLLKNPVQRFLEETRPHCLVAAFFFPFATDIAAKLGIPRLDFHGTGFFPKCAMAVVQQYQPHNSVLSDTEVFTLPNLPHQVKLTRLQMSGAGSADMARFIAVAAQAGMKSYGEIFNSFYELEPDYVQYYRNVLKRKCWPIGPVSLGNRGKTVSDSEHKCLEWLDSKESNSVIYVCFGSTTKFSVPQLKEIALALENSGKMFVWVVNKGKGEESEDEERIQSRGIIIRGWAPQVLILEHRAVGGFVTHCGWNSILEGISAGIPMVTWPVFAEQFYNEKLVTDILKIGVQVGSKKWNVMTEGTFLKSEEIEAALKRIMVGIEALEMRSRAKKLKDLAREAVERGGSSYRDLSSLIHELRSRQP
ncbi:UDP-glucose flavonoid 3-O-glucosyltransferase 7-like [Silene latifolia]|uniref:UDP-glucose flavonoid 3-O-glucosyltransferase 7-like n=1 Tax=Silene latifolia TaxID=37657 RepID=UPI003D778BC7